MDSAKHLLDTNLAAAGRDGAPPVRKTWRKAWAAPLVITGALSDTEGVGGPNPDHSEAS